MKAHVVFTLDSARWPALLVDSAGVVCRANSVAAKLFGPPLLDGVPPLLSAVWSPENSLAAEQFLAQSETADGPAMSIRFLDATGKVVSYLTTACGFIQEGQKYFVVQLLAEAIASPNGSKNHLPETTIWHKQKLDCALQMARTVSLDFNNALTSILGHTSLVLSKMEPGHPWRSSLLEVEKSAAKAAEIANDLATFSHQVKEARAQASGNLNSVLQRSVEFFQQNAGPDLVIWTLQLEKKLFAAKFDEARMQQVFVKVLENALQALVGSGRITVQTRNIELTEPTQDRNARLAAGTYICVEISDSGCGIPPDVMPRIFEPFFTTKKGGNHRGLGLAWVYGIVTNHGGGVAVSSQPAAGTSVRLYLPAEKSHVRENGVNTGDLTGTQTILMVDDEDLLLTMGQTILSSYGYRVLTANNGPKALELLAEADPGVDLVLTDLVMPTMSGRELVEQIRELSPATTIICTSGYLWPASQQNDPAYLQKPFTSQELLLKVKQALAE